MTKPNKRVITKEWKESEFSPQRQPGVPVFCSRNYILNETSKPSFDIFSNISAYIKHAYLKFTFSMDKSILESVSKFHYQN